jgi:hypothetical protein
MLSALIDWVVPYVLLRCLHVCCPRWFEVMPLRWARLEQVASTQSTYVSAMFVYMSQTPISVRNSRNTWHSALSRHDADVQGPELLMLPGTP